MMIVRPNRDNWIQGTNLNDIHFHSESYNYENARAYAVILFCKWYVETQTFVPVDFICIVDIDRMSLCSLSFLFVHFMTV